MSRLCLSEPFKGSPSAILSFSLSLSVCARGWVVGGAALNSYGPHRIIVSAALIT